LTIGRPQTPADQLKVFNCQSPIANHQWVYFQSTSWNFVFTRACEYETMHAGEHVSKMKNIFEVLKQKEDALKALQVEVDALRIAARLLTDDEVATMDTSAAEALAQMKPIARTAVNAPLRPATAAAGSYSAAWGNVPRQFP
jgi:hypothetical protein